MDKTQQIKVSNRIQNQFYTLYYLCHNFLFISYLPFSWLLCSTVRTLDQIPDPHTEAQRHPLLNWLLLSIMFFYYKLLLSM